MAVEWQRCIAFHTEAASPHLSSLGTRAKGSCFEIRCTGSQTWRVVFRSVRGWSLWAPSSLNGWTPSFFPDPNMRSPPGGLCVRVSRTCTRPCPHLASLSQHIKRGWIGAVRWTVSGGQQPNNNLLRGFCSPPARGRGIIFGEAYGKRVAGKSGGQKVAHSSCGSRDVRRKIMTREGPTKLSSLLRVGQTSGHAESGREFGRSCRRVVGRSTIEKEKVEKVPATATKVGPTPYRCRDD